MKDENETKEQLMNELVELRQRIAELEKSETEHKKVEKMLCESKEKYIAFFKQAADSIVLVDAETGVLVEFNDKAYKNLGYTREEFQKLKIPDFEVIESEEEVAEHIEKIIKKGADVFETKHRKKDGEIRNILVNSQAISVGGKDFIQSIWKDITERMKMENELRKRIKELEKFYRIAVNRELRMKELKNKIKEMESEKK